MVGYCIKLHYYTGAGAETCEAAAIAEKLRLNSGVLVTDSVSGSTCETLARVSLRLSNGSCRNAEGGVFVSVSSSCM